MATLLLTPVWVTAPGEKLVAIAATSSPAPMLDGFVLASTVPVAPPAGWSCWERRSENWAVCAANPSVSELAMSLPIVSRSVCMVSIPEAAVPSERTDMWCSYLVVMDSALTDSCVVMTALFGCRK